MVYLPLSVLEGERSLKTGAQVWAVRKNGSDRGLVEITTQHFVLVYLPPSVLEGGRNLKTGAKVWAVRKKWFLNTATRTLNKPQTSTPSRTRTRTRCTQPICHLEVIWICPQVLPKDAHETLHHRTEKWHFRCGTQAIKGINLPLDA